MAMPVTPEQWLPILTAELDSRQPQIAKDRRYASGKQDLPEMGENLRASWEKFQRKSLSNFGGLAVTSLCNRLRPLGVRVGESNDHPALVTVRRIWRDNRLAVQIPEAVRDAEETGTGYLVTGRDDQGRAVITRERPEVFYADPDPLTPWRARAALKVWRDKRMGLDFAWVWANGVQQLFERKSLGESTKLLAIAAGGWTPVAGAEYPYDGNVPVVIFERPDGEGYVTPHHDLIDRITLGKLNRLVIAAYQAFRQRAIKPGANGEALPEKDADGNDIDWADILEPAPGALWDLPVPIDIWESATTDMTPLLEGEKSDLREYGAMTGTPIAFLLPDNQSATGAQQVPMQLVFQAYAEQDRFKPALDVALVRALEVEGVDLAGATLEALWVNPEYVTATERYAAAAQAKGAGLASRTIKRDVLAMSPDAIAQDEADGAADLLATAFLTGAPPAAPDATIAQ